MKTLKRLLFSSLLFASIATYAQDMSEDISYGNATIDDKFCLVLDSTKPIQSYYKADMSGFGFTSEKEAIKYLGRHSNNLVSLRPDYEENKVIVEIHTDRTNGEKDIVWWNNYLESICKR